MCSKIIRYIFFEIKTPLANNYHVMLVGRGFNINLPVSSQDMLKSHNTSRALDVMIDAATTRLCTPIMKMMISITVASRKKGWFVRDCVSGTTRVKGSISHWPAPAATHNDTTASTILQRVVEGCKQAITSVRRLSKAFKSSQAVCSRDITTYEF